MSLVVIWSSILAYDLNSSHHVLECFVGAGVPLTELADLINCRSGSFSSNCCWGAYNWKWCVSMGLLPAQA